MENRFSMCNVCGRGAFVRSCETNQPVAAPHRKGSRIWIQFCVVFPDTWKEVEVTVEEAGKRGLGVALDKAHNVARTEGTAGSMVARRVRFQERRERRNIAYSDVAPDRINRQTTFNESEYGWCGKDCCGSRVSCALEVAGQGHEPQRLDLISYSNAQLVSWADNREKGDR